MLTLTVGCVTQQWICMSAVIVTVCGRHAPVYALGVPPHRLSPVVSPMDRVVVVSSLSVHVTCFGLVVQRGIILCHLAPSHGATNPGQLFSPLQYLDNYH